MSRRDRRQDAQIRKVKRKVQDLAKEVDIKWATEWERPLGTCVDQWAIRTNRPGANGRCAHDIVDRCASNFAYVMRVPRAPRLNTDGWHLGTASGGNDLVLNARGASAATAEERATCLAQHTAAGKYIPNPGNWQDNVAWQTDARLWKPPMLQEPYNTNNQKPLGPDDPLTAEKFQGLGCFKSYRERATLAARTKPSTAEIMACDKVFHNGGRLDWKLVQDTKEKRTYKVMLVSLNPKYCEEVHKDCRLDLAYNEEEEGKGGQTFNTLNACGAFGSNASATAYGTCANRDTAYGTNWRIPMVPASLSVRRRSNMSEHTDANWTAGAGEQGWQKCASSNLAKGYDGVCPGASLPGAIAMLRPGIDYEWDEPKKPITDVWREAQDGSTTTTLADGSVDGGVLQQPYYFKTRGIGLEDEKAESDAFPGRKTNFRMNKKLWIVHQEQTVTMGIPSNGIPFWAQKPLVEETSLDAQGGREHSPGVYASVVGGVVNEGSNFGPLDPQTEIRMADGTKGHGQFIHRGTFTIPKGGMFAYPAKPHTELERRIAAWEAKNDGGQLMGSFAMPGEETLMRAGADWMQKSRMMADKSTGVAGQVVEMDDGRPAVLYPTSNEPHAMNLTAEDAGLVSMVVKQVATSGVGSNRTQLKREHKALEFSNKEEPIWSRLYFIILGETPEVLSDQVIAGQPMTGPTSGLYSGVAAFTTTNLQSPDFGIDFKDCRNFKPCYKRLPGQKGDVATGRANDQGGDIIKNAYYGRIKQPSKDVAVAGPGGGTTYEYPGQYTAIARIADGADDMPTDIHGRENPSQPFVRPLNWGPKVEIKVKEYWKGLGGREQDEAMQWLNWPTVLGAGHQHGLQDIIMPDGDTAAEHEEEEEAPGEGEDGDFPPGHHSEAPPPEDGHTHPNDMTGAEHDALPGHSH